ncbi:DUF4861 domain-containing protein [Gracilimonas sp.]|uniref:DUF4861 domain-containing protein n=1 Tax=Gracilimonas sp. TaxID=1974203 RepID=UPI003BAA948F
MKNLILPFTSVLLLAGIAFTSCTTNHDSFTITNNTELARVDEPVVLSREQIVKKTGKIPLLEGMIPVPYLNDNPLPFQLDNLDGDNNWDELAFTLTLDPKESKVISVWYTQPDAVPQSKQRTNVRFGVLEDGEVSPVEYLSIADDELPVPLFTRFQMDGPAWENDKVGFRQYIDGRNGRDLYGKTSPEMVLDTVGIADDGTLEDNYHVMQPWGRDILAVGNSLGLGGLATLENDEVVRLGVTMDAPRNNVKTTIYQLITEGPVRSIFSLTYDGWQAGNIIYNLESTITIWAGSYGYTNRINLSSIQSKDTLAVGLVNIHNDKAPTLQHEGSASHTAFYTHDLQTYDDGWYLGMGLIFPKELYIDYRRAPDSGDGVTNSFLNLIELSENKEFEYQVVAGWELSNPEFADSAYFDAFMSKELQKVSNPLSIQ